MADRTTPKPAPKPKKRKLDMEDENKIDFTSPWHFSDVVLLVEDRKFHVHKAILSMWSPVFERMFSSEFRERSAPEIPLPGKSAKQIDALLNLMYSKQGSVT
ncbi:Kelch-like protein 15, partial [Exaiptasia diaphana]